MHANMNTYSSNHIIIIKSKKSCSGLVVVTLTASLVDILILILTVTITMTIIYEYSV